MLNLGALEPLSFPRPMIITRLMGEVLHINSTTRRGIYTLILMDITYIATTVQCVCKERSFFDDAGAITNNNTTHGSMMHTRIEFEDARVDTAAPLLRMRHCLNSIISSNLTVYS